MTTKLPPVTHVYIGAKLTRVDQLTLDEARAVITRLCDERDAALALAKRQPKGGDRNLMTPPRKQPP
jgi:hypothetical protein